MTGDEGDRRARHRVTDEDHVVVDAEERLGDELGVSAEARVRILDRQVDRDRTMTARGELGLEPLPAPGAVPGPVDEGERRHLASDVQAAPEVAEDEVSLRIRDVVERHGPETLDKCDAVRRVELVLDAAVDDTDVARAHLLRPIADRHRHGAVEDEHHLLGVLVAVARDGRPRRVRDVPEEHLVAGDRLEPHTREEGVGLAAVERLEGRIRHDAYAGTSKAIPPCATALTESSASNTTVFPVRVGSALASSARSTFSGVIGSSVTHTPTAS